MLYAKVTGRAIREISRELCVEERPGSRVITNGLGVFEFCGHAGPENNMTESGHHRQKWETPFL